MDELKLSILIIPTFDLFSIAIQDTSIYPTKPPVVTDPTLEINVPGFGSVSIPFDVLSLNILTSDTLGITEPGVQQPLPDGIYCFKYTVEPAEVYFAEKTIIRVDKLQEKFDEAFMKLDMMECDQAIKTQSKVEISTIYFFIQGAIAAANNCDSITASKLYNKASKMLDTFIDRNCGCSGTNYLNNFN